MNPNVNTAQTLRSSRPQGLASSLSLRDLLNSAFFYRRTALLLYGLLLLLGIVAVSIIPPSFTSQARLLTLSGGVYELQPGNPSDARVVTPLIAVDVEMQLLESAELHRTVLRQLVGAHVTGEGFDRQLLSFERHLHVSKLETGNVIELTYSDRDPQQAAKVMHTLLASYFDERAQVLTSGRVEFLTEQSEKIRAQLESANAQIEGYEREHGVADIAGQIASAVSLDATLRQRMTETDAAVADANRRNKMLAATSEHVPWEIQLYSDNTEAAHTVGTMEAELFNLQARRADLASRYMVTSPFVTQADAQIAALKRSIEEQKAAMPASRRTGHNTYKDTVSDRLLESRAALAGSHGRRSVLEGQMAASEARMKELITVNDAIARLTSQRDLLADTAKDYTRQLEQARIQQNQAMTADTTNVRVIEQPQVPNKRTNPPLLLLLAIALSAVVVVAVIIVILSSMRETFLTPEEAERALRLPVLSELAEQRGTEDRRRGDFGRLIAALDSVPTGGLGKSVLLLTSQSEGQVSEIAHQLVRALEPRSPGRVVHVHMHGEKGTAASRPVPPADPARQGTVVQLVMTMTRLRLKATFEDLRTRFDYVVVTAPPSTISFETLELTTVAELSVLVIEAERTRMPVVAATLAQATYIGGTIEGLLVTGRRYYIPQGIYRMLLGRGIL